MDENANLTESAEARDYNNEVTALLTAFPGVKGQSLPDEVVNESIVSGTPLVQAYADYRLRKNSEEIEALKKSGEKQPAAPIRPVTAGGSVAGAAKDPFLSGLFSY